ncbi:protein PYRICULARIA ORYZAE RESISTANCE 21-like isoform X2 [Prosopis cineraria]|uniref:protein PYRICULARIA ORYZAE RESISTANCE 21-like isoform X2 n=1 Tax=Prosopis cineraria TaxID=364024 RepID=UPI00240F238E|nr:protein PYRICULARIA ORYZAE RESISTANCE 21-like isoform X2 [Prosopis cineraria]
MTKKVTTMKLKVDLQCEKCSKKVKNVLCQFPHQVFDEKHDLVTIKVVCCSPERIRDQLCCKGGGAIMSIEIVESSKIECPPEPKCQKPVDPGKPKCQDENPTTEPLPCQLNPPVKPITVPNRTCCAPCYEGWRSGQCHEGCGPPKPGPTPIPNRTCCVPCYEGHHGGPCFESYGRPPTCYGGYFYARPACDSYGGGRQPCYVSRCEQYVNEDNVTGCTIM